MVQMIHFIANLNDPLDSSREVELSYTPDISDHLHFEWLIKSNNLNWHSGDVLMQIMEISHYSSSWYRLKNEQVLYIYIFICTSENISQYHRLKSCDIAYAFERGKQENIDEIETGTFIYITDISTHGIDSLYPVLTRHKQNPSPYIYWYIYF